MKGFVKKYRWVLVGLAILFIVVGFNVWIQDRVTSSSEVTRSPQDIPFIVHTAMMTDDNKTYFQYLVPSEQKFLLERDFDPSLNKQKEWSLPEKYRLIEYKATDNLYYYNLQYPDVAKWNHYFKVIKTKDGWKTWTFYNFGAIEFRDETQGLTPRVVREAKG